LAKALLDEVGEAHHAVGCADERCDRRLFEDGTKRGRI
jgi:hypothetical protein